MTEVVLDSLKNYSIVAWSSSISLELIFLIFASFCVKNVMYASTNVVEIRGCIKHLVPL